MSFMPATVVDDPCFTMAPGDGSLKNLKWTCAYEAGIGMDAARPGIEEQVKLLYGQEQNVIKEVVLGIGSVDVETKRYVNSHGIGFSGLDVLEFLCDAVGKTLNSRRASKFKKSFGGKLVFVKTRAVPDKSYVQPTESGDVIDGYHYKMYLVIGYRHHNSIHVRDMEVETARRFHTELQNVCFIAKYARTHNVLFFNVCFALVLMRAIESDPSKWVQAAETMLSVDGLADETVEGVLVTHVVVLQEQTRRLRRAFNLDAKFAEAYFELCKATQHFRAILPLKELLCDGFYAKLFEF